jgi:hypothetical protein
MRTSPEIDQISTALAKAQGALKNPEKNQTAKIPTKVGGSYSYNYADLPHTLDTIRGPLAQNGLCHSAGIESHAEGMILSVRLMHTSGQWIESDVGFPGGNDPKLLAANITYFRRYLLTALVGVAADDDLDSEPEAPQATYQNRGKPTQPVKSSALNSQPKAEQPKQEKPSEFDSVSSGVQAANPYASWETPKLEAYMVEMLDKLKARNMTAAQLKGEPKAKFEAVQQELTRRGGQQ